MTTVEKLIAERKAKVGIIGLGYVGLPLAVEFARGGFETTGFEVDAGKVKDIAHGASYIPDVPSAEVREFSRSGKLKATTDFSRLKKQDAVIICVPTPLRKSRDPDVSYIVNAAGKVAKTLRKGQLIILESTTYPGTTRELVKPMLEASGMKAGRDFHLAFSPERVDPGNPRYNVKNTPKVVGGVTPACTKLAASLYGRVIDKVLEVSNTETAELVKLLENTFRAVNIAMVNEMSLMCRKLGLNIWEVIAAAASKPFGFMPFYPGPGIGGHCIPLDPHYLAWKMKTLNFEPRFIELAGAINSSMPDHTVSMIAELLNTRGLAMKKAKLLMIGMTYKPDISDPRESPAKDVFVLLKKTGAEVSFYDPYVPAIEIEGRCHRSAAGALKNLKKYDCVIIITPHSCIDYKALIKNSRLVFDARNATKGDKSGKIHRL
ncbi:MAG: UDP-N-acetyl-D-glucosamine dehydrogenase [Elusimicrobia bacterium GWA2_56_46]|nr:MAG: UDP-N-acetyl-D-glucosamine dehydrogenase [Elusimicrobia bacterium GWA2_56_46]OGR56130.1 MAG: UDP-N-acetyl-D-glucosamine dehydrogenase [Elusimicrobia bacterium GWC2_56_31]HBW23098.1 UDP-N-acetyl-D-glucosamine dehydrogenase [Elusimicrobiota bacterium]